MSGLLAAFFGWTPSATLSAPQATDDFDGGSLDAAWTVRDGYAIANPGDAANHATVSVAGGQLEMSIPAGAEHNQWWDTDVEVSRAYEGSGVYETRVATGLADHQVGFVFKNADDTDEIFFMLYGNVTLWAYIERFVDGAKVTLPGGGSSGFDTGLAEPDSGPYHIRVTVRDDVDPSARNWHFQWSRDGETWVTIWDAPVEGAPADENIGTIDTVGLFAGSQPPSPFEGIDMLFDYYAFSAVEAEASAGDSEVYLSWQAVSGATGHKVWRSTSDGGPYGFLASLGSGTLTYDDTSAVNDTAYYYVVTADVGSEAVYSVQLAATPAEIPLPFDDAFDDASVDTRWTQSDPTEACALDESGGEFTILIPDGTQPDLHTAAKTAPRLLQAIPDGDFEVTARFTSVPDASTRQQGIVAQTASGTEFIRFDLYYFGAGLSAYVTHVNGGSNTDYSNPGIATAASYYDLRVGRTGGEWHCELSVDGGAFAALVSPFTPALTAALTQIGVYASRSSGSGDWTVTVDDWSYTP